MPVALDGSPAMMILARWLTWGDGEDCCPTTVVSVSEILITVTKLLFWIMILAVKGFFS